MFKKFELRLVEDWHWIVNHSWSSRFMALAFLLSAAEAIMPLLTDQTAIPVHLYAILMGLVSGAAFVARLVAQKRADGGK